MSLVQGADPLWQGAYAVYFTLVKPWSAFLMILSIQCLFLYHQSPIREDEAQKPVIIWV